MRKTVLAAVAAATVALGGCDTIGSIVSPAPLNRYVIDDRAVRYAFLTLDTLATLADSAMDAKIIVPGSAKANAVADGLVRAKAAVNAASAAQRAGSVSDYQKAFDEATRALGLVKQALGKSNTALVIQPLPVGVTVEGTAARLRAA
jgi:hypothetical protein